MKNCMGIIYTAKDELALREIASHRAAIALPVAGRYRVVDFLLSSMVNSGVRNVAIIAQKNYHSLMSHLGSGREWNLHTRNHGLYILPPFLSQGNNGEFSGLLDALRSNLHYLRHATQDYVILSGGCTIFSTSFEKMIQTHEDSGADITLLYAKAQPRNTEYLSSDKSHAYLEVQSDGKITDMEINPNAASYDNMYMDVLVVKRTLLIHIIDMVSSHGDTDFNRDVLQAYIRNHTMNIRGYEFTGYYRRIETILGYYHMNLDLLNPEIRHELFSVYPVYTRTRDYVPTLYRDNACVKNSLLANGCVVDGLVDSSILFRGVHIGHGAKIRNSIIMQDCYIANDVELENVILDKDVTIRAGQRLVGARQYPIVIGKNVTI